MDPTIKAALEQGFANVHQGLQQTLARFNDGSGFSGQESKQSFLLMKQQYNAGAVQQLEQDGLAARLAQLKASGIYPNNLPSGGNVWPTPPQ